MNNQDNQKIQHSVMDAIQKGTLHMRPRWHFVLRSSLYAIGAIILTLTLFYVVSLLLFLLHDTGAMSAPVFGTRGWFAFLHSVPLFLIFLIVIFVCLLQVLVREYAFAYRKPALASAIGIIILIFLGGFLIAQTSFHKTMAFYARHHMLPPPFDQPYSRTLRGTPPDLFRGTVLTMSTTSFVIADENGAGTTTVIMTPRTHLPDGSQFKIGSSVVVMGDYLATSTVQAFGVDTIDQ